MKFNVYLEYWKSTEVDANTEEEALELAKTKLLTDDNCDVFTPSDNVAVFMESYFNENHTVEEIEQ